MKNPLKIDAKSMLEKVMQKVWKMIAKWTTMGARIGPKSEKGAKNDIRKLMLKIDAGRMRQKHKKTKKCSTRVAFGSPFWPGRGVRGEIDT